MSTWAVRWQAAMMDTYGTPPVTLVRGSGAVVWDADGTEYLDLVAGIAVNSLGHAHPEVVAAVSEQVATLGHTSNLAIHPVGVELAERLIGLAGRPGRVFFCNSGAEANEAALKLSRLTGRHQVLAAEGGFHGRTMGALAMTGQPAKRAPFEPLVPGVRFVPYDDITALDPDAATAAVWLEPIQGEAGVVAPSPGYLAAAQQRAAAAGALFVLDEVQTGIGRTGAWFAHQHDGLQPDIVTLAKGLGAGLPIGAVIAFGESADLFRPGHHGSTFGGNPVAAAAATAVLDVIERDDLLTHATRVGSLLAEGLSAADGVVTVRGRGLLIGIVLARDVAREVEAACRARGVLVNACAPGVIRLAPPLILSDEQAGAAVERIGAVLEEVAA